jgi:hypothetical protein
MTHATTADATWTYRAREAVGTFAAVDALEKAVDELEIAGFDRAAISVLATDAKVRRRIGHLYESATDAADDPRAPQAAIIGRDSRVEGAAVAVGAPLYVGGVAGAGAAVAAGGTLAAAIAATILGGAIGAGLGALLALAVAQRHAHSIGRQLEQGGAVLWVGTPDEAAEKRALAVLRRCGASDVHVHAIDRAWRVSDRPLAEAQLDPLLLERDPRPR